MKSSYGGAHARQEDNEHRAGWQLAVVITVVAVSIGRSAAPAIAGPVSTPTLQTRTVLLSKEDADTDQRFAGWELIAYRDSGCQGHPVNDAFTGAEPVPLQLVAGQYSFLETMQTGWINVTPLCQDVDLTSANGALVFRNRHEGTPGPQPDLLVDAIADAQQPFDCVQPAGVKVTVRNAGAAERSGIDDAGLRRWLSPARRQRRL